MSKTPSIVDEAIDLLVKSYSKNVVVAYLAECDLFDLLNKMTDDEKYEYQLKALNLTK